MWPEIFSIYFLLACFSRSTVSNLPDMSATILKCQAESSSTAGHFVRRKSMWRKCPAEKPKVAGHFQVAKCPAGDNNVRQRTEHLWDILSGTPEIILIITEGVHWLCPASVVEVVTVQPKCECVSVICQKPYVQKMLPGSALYATGGGGDSLDAPSLKKWNISAHFLQIDIHRYL